MARLKCGTVPLLFGLAQGNCMTNPNGINVDNSFSE